METPSSHHVSSSGDGYGCDDPPRHHPPHPARPPNQLLPPAFTCRELLLGRGSPSVITEGEAPPHAARLGAAKPTRPLQQSIIN
jgi:hypothetical protein